MQITVTNNQCIEGLSKTQKNKIKDALTYDNPKYKQAKRYGRSKYISIPPYLQYYEDNGTSLTVPFGFNISSIIPNCPTPIINTNRVNVDYPELKIELRDDQWKALQGFVSYKRPFNKLANTYGVIQLPTGKGKTILAIYMAHHFNQKALILVHKDDLVVGWTNDILKCFDNKISVGLIKAKKRVIGEQFTIATVQTLARMSEEELSQYTNQFGMIIQDECHHVGANSFNIVDKFNCQFKIGLSATPTRTDGLNQCFDLFFGGIVYKHKYSKDDKDILPVEVRVKETKAKYRPFVIKNKQGVYATDQFFNMYDYDISELPKDFKTVDSFDYRDKPRVPYLVTDNAIVLDRRYKIMVCKDIIKEVRQGHSCLALFTQKEHIEQYNRYLCRFLPKNLISLYYGDSKEKSEVLMKRAENREVLVTLGTFAKATEGTNVKAWEVLFLVSSINNEKNVEQATGRIRRSSKNKLNPVVVYDYIHPNVAGIQSHYTTRKSVYNRLEYSIKYLNGKSKETRSSGSLFSRGY